MSMRKLRQSHSFIKRHLISISIIVFVAALCVGFFLWYSNIKNSETAKINRDTTDLINQLNLKISEIKAAKIAAESKARQEAAAKITAENAVTATNATSSTVDSASCNSLSSHKNPSAIDVIVNKKHCIQPVAFIPNDLISVGNGFQLSAKAAGSFNSLMAAASAANEPLAITSSYRSYSDQVSTYAYWVNVSGAAGADTYSARPGYSEHQTGLAFDVADAAKQYVLSNFSKTSQYQWLQANAADYGFIQRYYVGYEAITGYKAEEWHYRFVGVTVAQDMQLKNIKTLEEYWDVSGGGYF